MKSQFGPDKLGISGRVNVLMLTWEFPPRVIGGIAAHVHDLSIALKRMGASVFVITCDFPGAKSYEEVHGVHVHRIDPYRFPSSNFASWIFMMNLSMKRYGVELVKEEIRKGNMVLLHCHDWVVANAAIGLKHIFRMPLIATIHSTEHGRRGGIHSDYQRMIHQTESWLCHEAWRVLCCSKYMADQVCKIFHLSRSNIDVIPNGVNFEEFNLPYMKEFRRQFARDDERLVLYVGRLVYEKGLSTLLNSVNRVLQRVNAKFVIVGDGYMKDQLMYQAQRLGISQRTLFTGFLDDETVKRLYRVADVFVIPSLYEPFGIVALEAMASKTPIVASGVGGLLEIIEHDKTGVLVYPFNPESLAWGILRVLEDDGYAKWISRNALLKVINRYNWAYIAEETWKVYEEVLRDYLKGSWKPC